MKPTVRHEQSDSYATRFDARIEDFGSWQGQRAVTMAESWFYPESGGQPGDRGTLGSARVVDTRIDDEGRVWHLIEGDPGGGSLAAEVDWTRRFDHMQQHTGQHVLSAGFERVLQAPTLSSSLGAERSVIEVGLNDVDWRTIERVEAAAHQVLWEDRPIAVHWTDEAGLARFPLRRPPKVAGRIRIVEIPEWDWSACGGTHTRRTGEVGVIKITGWERVRGNLRFHFLCGHRAVHDHAWRLEALLEAAKRHTRGERELIAHLERAVEERDHLRKRLEVLEHRQRVEDMRIRLGSPPAPLLDLADRRSREDTRALVLAAMECGAPWAVVTTTGPEPQVILARGPAQGPDLRLLLPALQALSGGKGGGRADMISVAASDGEAARATHHEATEQLVRLLGPAAPR